MMAQLHSYWKSRMNNTVTIYGIKNCDTVKKALKFLLSQSISHEFIDYRESPISKHLFDEIQDAVGLEILINKRSTTYRALSDTEKKNINYELVSKHPTLIKRPVLLKNNEVMVGFDEKKYIDFLL